MSVIVQRLADCCLHLLAYHGTCGVARLAVSEETLCHLRSMVMSLCDYSCCLSEES